MKLAGGVIIAGLAIVLRAPFFAVDVIDWDESTFILMGKAWASGHLPYTLLWDNKPPLCFLPFALISWWFGPSIVATRILGCAAVVATAWLVAWIGREARDESVGFLAGFCCVVLVTFASRGQATMSETLAIFPLTLGALPLLVGKRGWGWSALSGVGFMVAALIRFNLAVVVVVAFILWLRRGQDRVDGVGFAAGVVLTLLATASPFLGAGEVDTLVRSVVVAPFQYAVAGTLASLLSVSVFFLPAAPRGGDAFWITFWALAGSVALSIAVSGGGAAHYWIQIHPFTAIAVGRGLGALPSRTGSLLLTGLLLLAAAGLSDSSWYGRLRAFEGFDVTGRARRLAGYLEARGATGEPVFLLTEHLAHRWLDSFPLHPLATHPSNIFRKELTRSALKEPTTPARVIGAIFEKRPIYVVVPPSIRHLDRAPEARDALQQLLHDDYTLSDDFEGLKVFRRREDD